MEKMILDTTLVVVLLVSGELGREDHHNCNHCNRHTHTYHSLWCGGIQILDSDNGNTQVTRYLG